MSALDEPQLGAIPDYPTNVLPRSARELVEYGEGAGLPRGLLAGAMLGALAAAIGPAAQLEVTRAWHERAILWVPLLGSRGAGKTPAQELAFRPLRDHDAQVAEAGEGTEILLGDQTLEALARTLHESGGAGALDLDELSAQLRGLGEYKRGGGGDRGRFLALWSGAPWSYTRAGAGGNKTNAVKLRIPRPTLSICGGLQTGLHELLGDEETGLRPRWLPHIGTMPTEDGALNAHGVPVAWQTLIGGELLPARENARTWRLDTAALAAFEHYRRAWKAQAREVETASTCAALVKADIHLARVVLLLAETEAPAAGGEVGAELVERGAEIIAYILDCWRALPEQGTLALSYRDATLDRGIPRLIAWLEEHGGQATRRDLQRAHAAGARTKRDLDLLLARYEATYPGTVDDIEPERGGFPTTLVRSPPRRPVSPVSPPLVGVDNNPSPRAKSHGVASGDTAKSGDTVATTQNGVAKSGDTDLATPTKTPTPKPKTPHTHLGDNGDGDTDSLLHDGWTDAELEALIASPPNEPHEAIT